jgi:hypothetical protein
MDEILKLDAYSEEFLTHFVKVLEKFVNEYDDMSQMELIKRASDLLKAFNE